ncbi:MAG: HEAT repeat domain-containing protein [Myxococcota bacterium]
MSFRGAACALVLLIALPVWAVEDPRVTLLSRQLAGAKDPRNRVQIVVLLGQTKHESAVPHLCSALKDPEPLVRTAAAGSLGELGLPSAIACLKAALGEGDPTVRAAMERALKAGAAATSVPKGGLYLSLEPVQDKVGDLPANLLQLAEEKMREKLESMGATFAPPAEDKKKAAALVRTQQLKAYQLRLQLLPGESSKGLKVEMLIMTYPDQSLKGTWNVKASGGKPESLIKAMVPRVVEDAATDLEWKH